MPGRTYQTSEVNMGDLETVGAYPPVNTGDTGTDGATILFENTFTGTYSIETKPVNGEGTNWKPIIVQDNDGTFKAASGLTTDTPKRIVGNYPQLRLNLTVLTLGTVNPRLVGRVGS